MLIKRDLLLALGFVVMGGLCGTLVLLSSDALYFYQSYMPELVYWACGSGFVHPAQVPKAISNFLALRTTTFDCGLLDASEAHEPQGLFLQVHLYLAWTVAALWRLLSISYRSLWPLVFLLVGAYASGCFVLLRLFFGRLAATAGALVLTLSPVMLTMLVYLRDYGKAPFFIWGIILLILAVRARRLPTVVGWALLAGMTVGIGYGFRSDVIVLLPIGLLFLAIGAGAWLQRAGACAAFAAAALLLASPMLKSSPGGGTGFLVMEGLSEPFRTYLDLGTAPYDFGQRYSDELTQSSIAAELRAGDPGWDAREGAAFQTLTQAVTRSGDYVRNWLPYFSGDLATQAIKSAVWIVGFPALVAPGRIGLDPGGEVRTGARARPLRVLYDLLGRSWLPAVCIVGLFAFFGRANAANPREAVALVLMFGALLTYPVVQFSVRHIFHLEFVWVLALLTLIHLPFEAAARQRSSLRFIAFLAALCVMGLGIRYSLTVYQDRSLVKLLGDLLGQPRELIADRPSDIRGDRALFTVPLPEQYRALVEGRLDSMTNEMGTAGLQADVRAAGDRLLLTLDRAACPSAKVTLSIRYAKHEKVWQPFDEDVAVDELDRSGNTVVLVPAFYRPSQYLSSIEIAGDHAACITRIERMSGPTVLPVVLTAVLSPGWQQRPLHRSFGGFPVRLP